VIDKSAAELLLKTSLGNPHACFRDGQWEAIDGIVNRRQKLLVVQRTGWGKSSVYFISTKIFRDNGLGSTIIVSPLLALMRNQIQSAQRLGIKAETINSTNSVYWDEVKERLLKDEIDCLFISPERLANDTFVETVLQPMADRISLMVIDEAHCISDWGHDFRPDYRRIVNILKQLPDNTPVLATTATANNRVVQDIKEQMGNLQIQRGPLTRESLALQTIVLSDQASRLAWLADRIPKLEGTGIVYTLTTRDAEKVANWLSSQGISAKAYHGSVEGVGFEDSHTYRLHLEAQLLNNQIKVLVATTALGMGYDKPDLGFVIHYQATGSIVGYYQQVGRAGRGIDYSVGILMSGNEDEDIHEYFRSNAFPSEQEIHQILGLLDRHDGLSVSQLEQYSNLRNGQINKVLKLLSVETPSTVIKHGSKWYRTSNVFVMDRERVEHLTQQRELEWAEVQEYISTRECKMNFLQKALDDNATVPCGKCSSCIGRDIIPAYVESEKVHAAASFLKHAEIPIKPKKQVAPNAFVEYGFKGNLKPALQAQEGRVLSYWNDAGWGRLVADGKHGGHFSDELVEALTDMIINRWKPDNKPTWLTCVPSKHHPNLVPDFAHRVANKLGIPFIPAIHKVRDNQPQKLQNNRFHQCHNLDGVFAIQEDIPCEPVFLLDDVVDSGWTLTVLAALLQQAGSGWVYPVALASSAVKDS